LLTYAVIDLGTLGGNFNWPNDINSSGQIVGASDIANGNAHAYVWQDGAITDLGTLGGAYSRAFAINDGGQVVGFSLGADGTNHAFLVMPDDTDGNGAADRWFRDTNGDGKNDLMLDLGPNSVAEDVNNAGQVVGYLGTAGAEHAFLWQSGAMTDLGTLGGVTSSAAAINEAGLVTGLIGFGAQGSHAFLWKNGAITDLGPSDGVADINDSGTIVDTRQYMGRLWLPNEPNGTSGAWGIIGALPETSEQDTSYSISYGINNRGQIVGDSPVQNYGGWFDRGFVWEGGQMSELPLHTATGINDAGQIVGYQGYRGYLLNVVVPQTAISISDAWVVEGDAGTTNAVFTVSLSVASDEEVSVNYGTGNGDSSDADAVAGVDYVSVSGTLRFAPGETSQTISVPVIGDEFGELDEYFHVALSSPSINAEISDSSGTGVIVDDDPPEIRIHDVSQQEGNAGTTTFTFTAELSVASDVPVSVNYTTANGSASAGSDYQPTSGTAIFAAGEMSKTITVSVVGDGIVEPIESFFVNLSNPTNATIGDGQAVGTIANDDSALPSLSVSDVSKKEGHNGTTAFTFTVRLSAPSSVPVSVKYATANGTATVAGRDYDAKSGTLTFQPGQTSKTVTVSVRGDRTREADETFFLNLANSQGATIGDGQGLGMIENDDGGTWAALINDLALSQTSRKRR
jgi:probable HAF family extracellular repeat protein